MTSQPDFASPPVRRSTRGSRVLLFIFGLVTVAVVGTLIRHWMDKPVPIPLRISTETTVVLEPLTADGTVDYVAWTESRVSMGVTPANNAAVALLQAMGPQVLDESIRKPVLQQLNLGDLPPQGRFQTLEAFVEALPAERLGLTPEELKAQSDEIRRLRDTLQEMHWGTSDAAPEQEAEVRRQYEAAVAGSPIGRLTARLESAAVEPWAPADEPLLQEWLATNAAALDAVLAASRRERFYLPLITAERPASLMAIDVFPLEAWRQASLSLLARATQSDGAKAAAEDLLAVHRLSRLAAQDWSLQAQFVAGQMEIAALKAGGAWLTARNPEPAQAARYIRAMTAMPPLPPVADVLNTTGRFLSLDAVGILYRGMHHEAEPARREQMRHMRDLADWNVLCTRLNEWHSRVVKVAALPPGAERNRQLAELSADREAYVNAQVAAVERRQSLGGVLRGFFLEGSRQGRQAMTDWSTAMLLLATVNPHAEMINDRSVALARRHLVQTAAALVVAADEGGYPESLQALVEAGRLEHLPLDPFSGRPLVYRRQEGGFILYSVGIDLADDGGRPGSDLVVSSTGA